MATTNKNVNNLAELVKSGGMLKAKGFTPTIYFIFDSLIFFVLFLTAEFTTVDSA